MALDEAVQQSIASGAWPGAAAQASYHLPFLGNACSSLTAWQQGDRSEAAFYAALFGLETLGPKGAWRRPAGAGVVEGPGQNATRVPVKTRDILANPASFKGASVADVEKHIPKGWTKLPAKKGEGGVRYLNPDKPGESIMIELGNPTSKDPTGIHRGLYLRIAKDGQKTWVPLKGNPTLEKK